MKELNYNYIIAGGNGFYEVAYQDLMSLSNVSYFKSYIDGLPTKLQSIIARLNFNLTINKYIQTPFRQFVFPKIFRHNFGNEKPICFLFFENQFSVINTNYIGYLKHKYPSAKFVLYMQDIFSSLPYYNINSYRRKFDCIISYDKGDSIKYNLHYHPTPFSKIDISQLPFRDPVDIYFCGSAKNRFVQIFDAYRKCKNAGLTCRFFVTRVPREARIDEPDIIYDKPISYLENLSNVASCKCVLEIMQKNADGFTPRLWESIIYQKHLLTNNFFLKKTKYGLIDSIHYTDEDLLLNWINSPVECEKDVIEEKSPIRFLEFVDNLISK